jgi:Phage tail sheath protein subtilisin-like domain
MSTIGINVIETEGSAAPAIAGAPTSVTGVMVRTRRGPTDRAVRVSNFRQFLDRFGGHDPRFAGAYAVEGMFANGGREAFIARVAGPGATVASVVLEDRSAADTLRVAAGSRGAEESGAWGNDVYVDVRDNPEFSTTLVADRTGAKPARLVGNAFTGGALDLSVPVGSPARRLRLAVDSPATNFDVVFDEAAVPVLTQAAPEDVAAAINAVAGPRVVASAAGDALRIVSRRKGADSKLELVGGVDDATRTLLGFTAAKSTATGAANAVANYDAVQVSSLAGLAVGMKVRLDDGISATWVEITALEPTGPGANVVRFAEPPDAEQGEYLVADGAVLATTEFDLVVRRRTPADPAPVAVESWEKLSMDPAARNYVPHVVNDPFTGSAYIAVADLAPGSFTGRDAPAPGRSFRLGTATPETSSLTRVAGTDGDDPTAVDYRSALGRFDTVAIQLLIAPEEMSDAMLAAVTRACLDYAEQKGECTYVGHTPAGRDAEGAKSFGQTFRAAKVFGALYWPWITVTDPVGAGTTPTRTVPPSGHVAGMFARIDQTRGVFKAPAGDEAVLRGALAVEREVTDVDHTDLVKNGSVNGIRPIRGAGIVVDASRTLSTDTRWLYVNVRLLFNFVKASLRDGLRFVKQEPNREVLWNMIKFNTVTPFLLGLFQQGAFGPGTAEDVFTVIVGPENNPPAEIALGNLRVEVYFFPSRPAETILIVIGQQESGATATES